MSKLWSVLYFLMPVSQTIEAKDIYGIYELWNNHKQIFHPFYRSPQPLHPKLQPITYYTPKILPKLLQNGSRSKKRESRGEGKRTRHSCPAAGRLNLEIQTEL
ncbi:hypothetical protein EV426DRAFT_612219 [Tirmania nivea]|nr:hypothetical protein EV426DRAFT_612219 [Tirmania nivea]